MRISRTLTPIMIRLLLRTEHGRHGASTGGSDRFHAAFNARFDRFRDFYGWLLARHPAPSHHHAGRRRHAGGGRRSASLSSSAPTSFREWMPA